MARAVTDHKLIFTPNLKMLGPAGDNSIEQVHAKMQFRRRFNDRSGSVLVTPAPQKTRFDMNFP